MDTKIQTIIHDYLSTQPIQKAWVFGSFSRGEERPDSDVDILVSFIPGTHMGLRFFGLALDLEKLLGRRIDLVVEGDLMPYAAATADHDKILVYDRTSQR